MIWLILALAIVCAVAGAIGYYLWRSAHLETARQVESLARQVSVSAGRAAAAASRSAVDATAALAEAARQARMPLRWCGAEETLKVASFTIRCPLTYTTQVETTIDEPSLIDLRLPARESRAPEGALPYWPSYRHMSSGQRFEYLRWMAERRRFMPSETGYAFVFFYGLERRALIDRDDFGAIAKELLRLRDIHAKSERFSWSFEQYSASLLWYLIATTPSQFDEQIVRSLMESTRSWKEEQLNAALAWFASTGRTLPNWAAIIVAGQLPQAQRSVVTQRVADEFNQLFFKRYRQQFGEGMTISIAASTFPYSHQPASAVIAACRCAGPNPLGISVQFKPLAALWNSTVDDLRRLSSVVGREGDGELTPTAWESMPPELRSGIDHPLTVPMCRLVEAQTDGEGRTLVEVNALAGVCGLESRAKLTPTQSRRICETAEFIGYGLEPDARLSGKGYRAEERVAVFLQISDEDVNSQRYSAAACMLRLGLGLAAADGEVHPDEVSLLTKEIERMFDLNGHEQRRLEALRTLLIREGPDLKGLSSLAASLNRLERQAVGRLLVALAAEDGVVTREEIRAVRKCYKMIGLNENDADSALSSLREMAQGGDDEPVTVRQARQGRAGEAIPVPPPDDEEFRLDTSAIRAIMAETREVAGILAEAMGVTESQSEFDPGLSKAVPTGGPSAAAVIDAVPTRIITDPTDLPETCSSLLTTLLTRERWAVPEADQEARKLGLMLNGAVETINEWSVERFGAALIYEETGALVVETSLMD